MPKKEVLDIVDSDDEAIGEASREEAHQKHLRHRAVHAMIFNPKGELFVQKRSAEKDVFPSYYEGSLSGHVIVDESYEAAAVRELKEELGVSVKEEDLRSMGTIEVDAGKENELVELFVIENYSGQIKIKKEVESGKFMKVDDVKKDNKKKYTPAFLKALEKYSE